MEVTCLALACTTDLMLAVGSYEGQLAIYQIPKPMVSAGSAFPGTVQDIQHFALPSLHARTITALSWSANGARLFSGDNSGLVAATEVDFFQNSVTSRVVVRPTGDNCYLTMTTMMTMVMATMITTMMAAMITTVMAAMITTVMTTMIRCIRHCPGLHPEDSPSVNQQGLLPAAWRKVGQLGELGLQRWKLWRCLASDGYW